MGLFTYGARVAFILLVFNDFMTSLLDLDLVVYRSEVLHAFQMCDYTPGRLTLNKAGWNISYRSNMVEVP